MTLNREEREEKREKRRRGGNDLAKKMMWRSTNGIMRDDTESIKSIV